MVDQLATFTRVGELPLVGFIPSFFAESVSDNDRGCWDNSALQAILFQGSTTIVLDLMEAFGLDHCIFEPMNGQSLLENSIMKGKKETFLLLWGLGHRPSIGFTPSGNMIFDQVILETLIDNGYFLTDHIDENGSLLEKLIRSESREVVEYLLKTGHFEKLSKTGYPLHFAACYGFSSCIKTLVGLGRKLDEVYPSGHSEVHEFSGKGTTTPLMAAILSGQMDAFKLMAKLPECTPTMITDALSYYDEVEVYLDDLENVPFSTTTSDGFSLLMYQVLNPTALKKIVNLWEKHSVEFDVDQKDNHGMTPLLYSLLFGENESAEILLSAGADIRAVNNKEECALTMALICPDPDEDELYDWFNPVDLVLRQGEWNIHDCKLDGKVVGATLLQKPRHSRTTMEDIAKEEHPLSKYPLVLQTVRRNKDTTSITLFYNLIKRLNQLFENYDREDLLESLEERVDMMDCNDFPPDLFFKIIGPSPETPDTEDQGSHKFLILYYAGFFGIRDIGTKFSGIDDEIDSEFLYPFAKGAAAGGNLELLKMYEKKSNLLAGEGGYLLEIIGSSLKYGNSEIAEYLNNSWGIGLDDEHYSFAFRGDSIESCKWLLERHPFGLEDIERNDTIRSPEMLQLLLEHESKKEEPLNLLEVAPTLLQTVIEDEKSLDLVSFLVSVGYSGDEVDGDWKSGLKVLEKEPEEEDEEDEEDEDGEEEDQ